MKSLFGPKIAPLIGVLAFFSQSCVHTKDTVKPSASNRPEVTESESALLGEEAAQKAAQKQLDESVRKELQARDLNPDRRATAPHP